MHKAHLLPLLFTPLLLAQSECEPEVNEPMEIEPDFRFVGDQVNASTGSRLSAGDVDGDGLTDYMIASLKTTVDDVEEAGVVYISYGSGEDTESQGLDEADAWIHGEDIGDLIGYEAEIVDDFNADGKMDILVASRSMDPSGGAFLFFGPIYGAHSVYEADIIFEVDPLQLYDVGRDIDSAGDVNGDGFNDLIITASVGNTGDGAYSGGHSFVIFGPQAGGVINLPDDADATFVTPAQFAEGAGAGDVNGDGIGDVILGSPSDGRENKGAAFLFYGPIEVGTHLTEDADAIFRGEDGRMNCSGGFCTPDGDDAGGFVGPAGDMNQDGYDDVYVLADGSSEGAGDGVVYLIYGPVYGDNSLAIADVLFYPEYGGAGVFGFHVESADLNGDGWLDTLLSHTNMRNGSDDRVGGAVVWYGPHIEDKTHSTSDMFIMGSAEHGTVSLTYAIPDLDGDTLPELFIGNPYNDAAGDWPGGAYIVNSTTYGAMSQAPASLAR